MMIKINLLFILPPEGIRNKSSVNDIRIH